MTWIAIALVGLFLLGAYAFVVLILRHTLAALGVRVRWTTAAITAGGLVAVIAWHGHADLPSPVYREPSQVRPQPITSGLESNEDTVDARESTVAPEEQATSDADTHTDAEHPTGYWKQRTAVYDLHLREYPEAKARVIALSQSPAHRRFHASLREMVDDADALYPMLNERWHRALLAQDQRMEDCYSWAVLYVEVSLRGVGTFSLTCQRHT